MLLLLTNTLPIATLPTTATDDSTGEESAKNPYAYPTALVTTIYHALTAFYLYAQLSYGWNFAFTSGMVGSGLLFCLGMWVVLFGDGKGRVSKRTGADKRTSNFPFENKESARAIKKETKQAEKEKRRSFTKKMT